MQPSLALVEYPFNSWHSPGNSIRPEPCLQASVGSKSPCNFSMAPNGVSIFAPIFFVGSISTKRPSLSSVNLRFPRYFVFHQVDFMQPAFPDIAHWPIVRGAGLASDSQASNAAACDYKRLRCIQSCGPHIKRRRQSRPGHRLPIASAYCRSKS